MTPDLIPTPPASPRRKALDSVQSLRPWLRAGVIMPIVLSAAITAVWVYLAFFRGGHSASLGRVRASLLLPLLALCFACCFLAVGLAVRRVAGSGRRRSLPSREWLARCSLASCVLLAFFPEYLAKTPPIALRSILLSILAISLYLVLCAHCRTTARDKAGNAASKPERRWNAIGLGGLGILFAIMTTLAIRKYSVFGYVGQDLAYFGQIMYTTVHGHLFWGNLLQDLIYSQPVSTDFAGHNSAIMLLLVPFYALAPHPISLLVLRNLILIACAAPVFAIARRSTSNGVAWLWVAVFLLTPAILYQSVFDFYPLTFVALPLLCTVYFYLERAFGPFCVCLALTLLVREDLVFFVFGMGVLALVARRSRRWVYVPLLAAVVWAALSFRVVLPMALHGATFVTDVCFSHLGHTPGEMLRRVLLHPRENVLVHGNIVYLKTLLTASGIVLSGGSLLSVLALPYVAINLLAGAGRCITTVIFAQYSVIPATLLFVGALLTATSPRRGRLAFLGRLGLPLASAAPLLLLALCLGSLIFVTERTQVEEFRSKPWNAEALRVAAMIPAHASVAAPRYMLPHLADRDCLYQTHRLLEYHTPAYEYLIIDKDWRHINAAADYEQEYGAVARAAAANPRLTLLYSSSLYAVYRDPAAHGRSCSAHAAPPPSSSAMLGHAP